MFTNAQLLRTLTVSTAHLLAAACLVPATLLPAADAQAQAQTFTWDGV